MNIRTNRTSNCNAWNAWPMVAAGWPRHLRIGRVWLLGACCMAALLGPAAQARAVATFDAKLQTSLTLSNKNEPVIGFVGTFPKPDPNDKTQTQPKKVVEKNVGKTQITAHTAKGQNRTGLGKQNFLPKTMELQAAGWASANGSIAELALWASGYQQVTLMNRSGFDIDLFGNARNIDFDLTFDATGLLSAIASNDPQEVDFARAQLLYRVLDVESGTVLTSAGETVADMMTSVVANEGETKNDAPSLSKSFTVTVPGAPRPNQSGKYKLGIEAYVYGRALSLAVKDGLTDADKAKQDEAKKAYHERLDEVYPDPAMRLRPEASTLSGDATSHGSWQLDSVAGVPGSDPLARHGLDTVFLSQTATTLGQPFDVELTLEVPPQGVTQVAIENSLFAPAGLLGRDYHVTIGTGVGNDFQQSTDLESLALFGANSELAPQVLDGEFVFLDADNMLVSSLWGPVGATPSLDINTLLVANVADGADGVVDGMATLTIRQMLFGVPGDYNGDGHVDGQDYVVWRSDFGRVPGHADGNGDGNIDVADYVLWRDRLGPAPIAAHAAPLANRAIPIPEPSIAILMIIATCLAGPTLRMPRKRCSVVRAAGKLNVNL